MPARVAERISYSVSAQTGDLRTRNSLVVAVPSQQRGCQARRRCDTREMTSGITVSGAYVDLQAAVSAQHHSARTTEIYLKQMTLERL